MATRGHQIFAERLTRFAADAGDPAVDELVRSVSSDIAVAVHGRPGVGRRAVARGLRAAGLAVARDGAVDVYVIAEVPKPEDEAAIRASAQPKLLVLNKADLVTGVRALCARYREQTGVTTVPMVAHLTGVQVDDALLNALRAGPGEQVLEVLDAYGTAHALAAVRAGADAAALTRVLRVRSGVDGVVAALAAPLTEAGYQRVRRACAALERIAAGGDDRIAAFLRDDDTVTACMAAAVDVVAAAGLPVDPSDHPAAHLRRAAHWQRYRRGPVNALHTACAADIERGSLRLWRRAGARPT